MPASNKIQVGYIEAQDGAQFQVDAGTAAAPGLVFDDSLATGLYSPGTGQIAWSTSGKQTALRILADGKVGVDCSPTVAFQVNGTIKASAFDGPITQTGDFTIDDWIVHAGDTNTKIGFSANDTFQVHTGGSARLTVTDSVSTFSNNIDTSVLRRQVQNSSVIIAGGNATNDGANIAMYGSAHSSQAGNFEFRSGGTYVLKIKSDGKIGINENSPDALLHLTNIASSGIIAGIRLESSGTSNSAGDTMGQIEFAHNDADDAGVSASIKCTAEDNAGNTYLTFNNGNGGNADERLRITSGGNFRFGNNTSINNGNYGQWQFINRSSTNGNEVTNGEKGLVVFTGKGFTGANVVSNDTWTLKLVNNAFNGAGVSGNQGTVAKILFNTATSNGWNAFGAIGLDTVGTSGGKGDLFFNTGGTTNGNERLRITSAGNVAIGNVSPQQLLHVWPDTVNTTSAYVRVTAGDRNSNTGIDIGQDASGDGQVNVVSNGTLSLSTNNAPRIKISNSSAATSIGGAMTFNSLLTTQGDVSGGLLLLKAAENSNRFFVSGSDSASCEVNLYDANGTQQVVLGCSTGAAWLSQVQNNYLQFKTNNTERVRIFADGGTILTRRTNGGTEAIGNDANKWFKVGTWAGSTVDAAARATITVLGANTHNSNANVSGETKIHLAFSSNLILYGYFYSTTAGYSGISGVAHKYDSSAKSAEIWVKYDGGYGSTACFADVTNGFFTGDNIATGSTSTPSGATVLGSEWNIWTSDGSASTRKFKINNNGNVFVQNTMTSGDAALNVLKSAGDNTNKAIVRVGYDEANCLELYRTRADGTIYINANQSGSNILFETQGHNAMFITHKQSVHIAKLVPKSINWSMGNTQDWRAASYWTRFYMTFSAPSASTVTFHVARMITQADWGFQAWSAKQVKTSYSPDSNTGTVARYYGYYGNHYEQVMHINERGNVSGTYSNSPSRSQWISRNANLGPGGTLHIHNPANGGYYRDCWATDYYVSFGGWTTLTLEIDVEVSGGHLWDGQYTAQQIYPAAFNGQASQSDANNWNGAPTGNGRGIWFNCDPGLLYHQGSTDAIGDITGY